MTSFINAKYSAPLHGADQAESWLETAQQFSSQRGFTLLMLAAIAAAVTAVAYTVMDSPAESHLLMIWIGLWAVVFPALAMCAAMALHLKGRLDDWSRRLAETRADQRLWAMARQDSRIMADLQSAMMRQEALAEAQAASAASAPSGKVAPELKRTPFMARPYI